MRKKEKKRSIFGVVSDLDLFAPKSTQNDYGARGGKKLSVGNIKKDGSSYVPSGMTAAEYNNIRSKTAQKKAANYQMNVAKAGKFIDYTDWYIKRGTDINDNWITNVTGGHTMAKTKFDWGNIDNDKPDYTGSKSTGKKAAPKKKVVAKKVVAKKVVAKKVVAKKVVAKKAVAGKAVAKKKNIFGF